MVTEIEAPSVPELCKVILESDPGVMALAPGGVTVGPATAEMQEKGCIVLRNAGIPRPELYVSLTRGAMSIQCISASVEHTDRLAGAVYRLLHRSEPRQLVVQPSTGRKYLVHSTFVTAGPVSAKAELENTFVDMLVAVLLIGTRPVIEE